MSTAANLPNSRTDEPEEQQLTLDELTKRVLYNFLDQANPIGGIARSHGESIERVLNACTSPLARKFLRSVARAEKLRSCVLALRARGRALHGLTVLVESEDDTPAGRETRRRAADSILRATAPQRHSAKPTSQPALQPIPPQKTDRTKRADEPAPRPRISPKDWPEHMRQVQLKYEQRKLHRQQLERQEQEREQANQPPTLHPMPHESTFHPQSHTTPPQHSPSPHPSSLTQTPISTLQSAAGAPIHRD